MTQNISIPISPSNSSITSSGYSVSTASANNQNLDQPKPSDYIKTHKNISFSFAENLNSFQLGNLGDSDTYLVGTVHLNYPRVCAVKSVFLHFKGIEKTCWYKSQARTKNIYSGEYILVDQSNKIWEAFEESEGITDLDIPFKIQLPNGLHETITTNIGTVQYVLRVVVNTKGLINIPNTHIAKLHCPLKQTLILNHSLTTSYKICGESPNGIEYTFILPPNKNFNMGSFVSIPMMIRFTRPGIGIDRLEISLKALMDFSCSTQNEKNHSEQRIGGLLISNSELRNMISNNSQYHSREFINNINLFVPRDIQQTYQGNLISISHQLSIKFSLFGFEKDFQVDEFIRISRTFENLNEEINPKLSPLNYNSQMYNNNNINISNNDLPQQIQHQQQQQQQQLQQIQLQYQQQQQKIQQQNMHQNQQNVQLTQQHESFGNQLFRSHSLNYHQLVAPFDDQFYDDNIIINNNNINNNGNNSNDRQLASSHQLFHPQPTSQHFLYQQPSFSNLSTHSSISSNGSNHFRRHNSRRKLPQLSIHEDSSESDISSHSLPSPPLVVNETNTIISKSPYPTPLSPPPYRQPIIRESSFGNKNSANYYKYKKYTE
ncbi:hypothetical protein Glove_1g9 [Diversispora epigaea]|uniref:Arrestin-like N-terminal domain-containing protein n=1 Tax=Diversispora epigaea TaxID=1348612 RepID=A0A397JZL2_9GLOM|nr:hypothetical protein Glove_1g9 [Diversispora epigaea]